MAMKKWSLSVVDKNRSSALAEECGIEPFLALLLVERGIDTPEKVQDFLYTTELVDDPFSFADMDMAVTRIGEAINSNEKICIFGDYDADGITATVLLYSYLKEKGANVQYRLPYREGEGYGLHESTIHELAENEVSLLITVDNGIAAIEEVELAKQFHMDVVVTDHHLPQDKLPDAVAVVNPHRPDCESEFKGYAGVGVAFKLVCALEGDSEFPLENYADLVALGTLADIMPLSGENRVLVRQGLSLINMEKRPGLAALAHIAGAGGKEQTSSSAVFTLAPRINAAGRMGDPQKAAELLLATDAAEAERLAEEIQQYNQKRQETESVILKDVQSRIESHPEWLHDRVLVIDGKDWFSGVVGILAARVLEKYGKPCILLSELPDKVKGSGRSIKGFPLFDAIASCSDILNSYGGHELAAGVSLDKEHVEEFRTRVNQWAETHFPEMPDPELHIACKISPAAVSMDILKQIRFLDPCGSGNPLPVFQIKDMVIRNVLPVKNGQHVRVTLSRDKYELTAMWFHMTEKEFPFAINDTVSVAVTLDRNDYRGIVSVSVIIKDMISSEEDRNTWLQSLHDYDSICRHVIPQNKKDLLPSRDTMAKVYTFLRKNGGFEGRIDGLQRKLPKDLSIAPLPLLVGLHIMNEAGVLTVKNRGSLTEITVPTVTEKSDLTATTMWQELAYM